MCNYSFCAILFLRDFAPSLLRDLDLGIKRDKIGRQCFALYKWELSGNGRRVNDETSNI